MLEHGDAFCSAYQLMIDNTTETNRMSDDTPSDMTVSHFRSPPTISVCDVMSVLMLHSHFRISRDSLINAIFRPHMRMRRACNGLSGLSGST